MSDYNDIVNAGQTVHDGYGKSDGSDSDEELDFDVKSYLCTKSVGPNIHDNVAKEINNALLGSRDTKAIEEIHNLHPIPGNIEALNVPTLNHEIKVESKFCITRENSYCSVQKEITSSTGILASMMWDVGKKKNRILSREEMFKMLNDSISLLTSSYI